MLANDGIGARCIDNVDVAKKRRLMKKGNNTTSIRRPIGIILMPKHLNTVGGRRDALLNKRLPEQGVDKSRFAAVKFTDNNQKKEFIKLTKRFGEPPLIRGCYLPARQNHLQFLQNRAFVDQQVGLFTIQYRSQHIHSLVCFVKAIIADTWASSHKGSCFVLTKAKAL